MGRKRTPEAEVARLKAIELSKKFYTCAEISRDVGWPQSTIEVWIRDWGRKPSPKDAALELHAKGWPLDDICRMVRRKKRTVRGYLQIDTGHPRRHSPKGNVDRFLRDPVKNLGMPFTRKEPFGISLVARCLSLSDAAPREGLVASEAAIGLFEHLRTIRRTEKGVRQATCNLLLARGLNSHCNSLLGRHEKAFSIVESGIPLCTCPACAPDHKRRMAVALHLWANAVKQRDPDRALEMQVEACRLSSEAVEAYRILPIFHSHDLYGNGLANSLMANGLAWHGRNDHVNAVRAGREGLALVDPHESPTLHRLLLANVAHWTWRLGESEFAQMGITSRELLEKFKTAKPTPSRALAHWLVGLLAKEIPDALHYLNMALSDAELVGMQTEAIAIIADIAERRPNPREFYSQVWSLCDWVNKDLLRDLQGHFNDLLEALRKSKGVKAAARALRAAIDGDGLIPVPG